MSSASLDRTALHRIDRALATEWLETDGVGGFASSTVLGCATRRYHGLLIARPSGLHTRHMFLSAFDDRLVEGETETLLSPTAYRGVPVSAAPAAEAFEIAPCPTTTLRGQGGALLRRQVLMPKGRPAVLCTWTVESAAEPVELLLRPRLACRPADGLHFRNEGLDPYYLRPADDQLLFQPYPTLPPLYLSIVAPGGFEYQHDPAWFEGIEYRADLERGYDGHEDQWSPGTIRVRLAEGEQLLIAASIEEPLERPAQVLAQLLPIRELAAKGKPGDPPVRRRLARSADDFLFFTETDRLGICAGYPWFDEWGRDVFLALPGLTLSRGRISQCAEVLEGALEFLRDGLLPNIYGASQLDSHYGSADASLWYSRAVRLYAEQGGDRAQVLRSFRPALEEIATAYHEGTELGIRANDELLIEAGSEELNATWMDANASDGPVTPRHGCAVEIQALWYDLLDHCASLAEEDGDRKAAKRWTALRDQAGASFIERLWLPGRKYLADRWHQGEAVAEIRPNMVLAASMAHSPLSLEQRRGVVDRATTDLLTPRGLRTLARSDPAFEPRYRGNPDQRDRAYHQGTVWPWLLGCYVEACLRAYGKRPILRLRVLLDGFLPELNRAGLDHVSEVFDADVPQHPGGTIAQAWNSAELLRAYALLDSPPPQETKS